MTIEGARPTTESELLADLFQRRYFHKHVDNVIGEPVKLGQPERGTK
jgi:hypothetical protein